MICISLMRDGNGEEWYEAKVHDPIRNCYVSVTSQHPLSNLHMAPAIRFSSKQLAVEKAKQWSRSFRGMIVTTVSQEIIPG